MFKHPLENPSLAPFGLTTQVSYRRLQYKPTIQFHVNEERMSARFWEKHNRAGALPPLPVRTIVHDILPGQAQCNRIARGDFVFDGLPYLTRDIVTLSSIVQWFGTNVGREFIDGKILNPGKGYHPSREFVIKLDRDNQHRDMYTFWCHRCTGACRDKSRFRLLLDGPCLHDPRTVTERDKAMVDGLMRWLGSAAGRNYITDYRARRDRAWEAASQRRRRTFEIRKNAA